MRELKIQLQYLLDKNLSDLVYYPGEHLGKDGSIRLCIDYGSLIRLLSKTDICFLRLMICLINFKVLVFFSKIDLWSGYHLLKIKPEDVAKQLLEQDMGTSKF